MSIILAIFFALCAAFSLVCTFYAVGSPELPKWIFVVPGFFTVLFTFCLLMVAAPSFV